jgi:AAA15 family ATPase/GTPase
MQLIKKTEINYLRSLYGLEISDTGNLNVVFGRNDSGKSNLLRGLNLFFNGKSEPFREFDFGLDMSDIRKSETREVKGRQFIWIKITFRTPPNYVQSLGEEIEIKRQWNRDGAVTETVWPRELSGDKKKPRLTRFLNDIAFTYIPATKDF